MFRIAAVTDLSQRDAGQAAAVYNHGTSVKTFPSDADGGHQMAKRSSLGQPRRRQAHRNAMICTHCRLALAPTRRNCKLICPFDTTRAARPPSFLLFLE